MTDPFSLADALGPAKVVHIHEPAVGLRAIVVIDNVARGPAIGGTRMAPDVTLEECFRLARAMTLKNAAAGLPHGGAKSVIAADPAMPVVRKEQLVRAFARAIAPLTDYIPGPDMGTDETAMAWVKTETGRAAGLPRALGGIPLDEIGATGYGVAVAGDVAQAFAGFELQGARLVVQGFGAVGQHAARFLTQKGARLVATSDSRGAIAHAQGFDVEALIAHKAAGRALSEFAGAQEIPPEDLVAVRCEIWVPAARPDVLREDNVDRLQTRLVLQGANIPATLAAERRMHDRGIVVVPDFIANAGGVICAAVEVRGGTERSAFEAIEEAIRRNTREVLERSRSDRIMPRAAAEAMARARVTAAMQLQRWH